jgi:hypothetical protein
MKHCVAAAAAILVAGAAPLAAQDYAPDRLKKSVTQADLVAVAGSLGHQVIEQGDASAVYVVAETQDATRYFLIGTACDVNDVPGCQGIMMQVRYDLPETTTFETLAKANLEQAALNSWADFEDRTLGFTRYQVLDNGVMMANIRENVNVLLVLVQETYPVAAGEE